MTSFEKFFIDHKSSTRKAISKINKLGGSSLIVTKNKKYWMEFLVAQILEKQL